MLLFLIIPPALLDTVVVTSVNPASINRDPGNTFLITATCTGDDALPFNGDVYAEYGASSTQDGIDYTSFTSPATCTDGSVSILLTVLSGMPSGQLVHIELKASPGGTVLDTQIVDFDG